jgi:hypothetical protein
MQNRARTTGLARQLRRRADAQAGPQQDAPSVPRKQALAVWLLEHASRTDPLPCELARAAILHYTDPGDLVLAPKLRGGELLQTAAALGRRALPLAPSAASAEVAESVIALRAGAGAALVLAPIGARASERRLERVAARLLPLLRPGGFLALARGTGATRSDALCDVVRACQDNGLQYWQHVIALRADLTDGNESGTRTKPERTSTAKAVQARRHHRDLLVFRRSAHAEQAAACAVAAVAA